jgi:hypothetical protein
MTTANARKGAETERMVAKYLVKEGFPLADRRLREGRADDQGDIDGVPFTVIQVKYVAQKRMQQWVLDTLKQRDTAGAPLCLLVVRTPHRAVSWWDTYMPLGQIYPEQIFGEEGTPGWIRMNLVLAVALLRRKITEMEGSLVLSSRTTSMDLILSDGTKVPFSVPSTGNGFPPSPTT